MVRCSEIVIEVFKLAHVGDAIQFRIYQDQFLNLLEVAYKNQFLGREITLSRIYGERHVVFLAFKEGNLLAGCSYIRPDGKLGGIAVLPQCQGCGIARRLINISLKFFPVQFVETDASNYNMKRLLTACGFRPVLSEEKLRHFLGVNVVNLCSIRYKDCELVYVRFSATCPNVRRELVMFEYDLGTRQGTPQ